MANGLFLLIDALRWDVLAEARARKAIVPHLAALAERGFVRRVVTNAQSTQFVVPSIFSLTYPLDHGGYANGIRERPKSYVEALKDAGFETHLMATCNQLGLALGFERGFDTVRTTSDYRTLLEQRVGRTLRHDLASARAGERSEAEAKARVVRELDLLLDGIAEGIRRHDKTLWPKRLHRINARVAAGCAGERALLARDPEAVLAKIERVAPGLYWRFLGERRPGRVRLFLHRAVEGATWRTRTWIANQSRWPFLRLSHYPVPLAEIVEPLCRFIEGAKDRRWAVHMHAMDLHDCRAINHPLLILARLRFLPRWFALRARGLTRRRWLYDVTLMDVDRHVGRIVAALERSGQLDRTVVLVTGDHGLHYAESPRPKYTVGWRTHYEDIEVPLLLANAGRPPGASGLVDSMGVTATFLDALGVPLHQSFKGKSAFGPGRAAVISENCGHGNADPAHRDIFFTVTTESHKLMGVLKGTAFTVERLYDLAADPRELVNLAGRPEHRQASEELIAHLRRERADIFALRRPAAPHAAA